MKPRSTWPAAAGLTFLAAALRLAGLGRQSYWSDELHTLALSGVHGPAAAAWRASDLLLVTQGPLFMGLVHLWSRAAGAGEAALRLLPAAFAIATVPAFLGLAGRLVERRVALAAALLLAVSPFHVWYAQELRGYSLAILAAVVATRLVVDLAAVGESGARRVRRERGAPGLLRGHLLYAASLAAGLGASLTMGFVVAFHGLVIAARARALGQRRVAGLAAVFLAVAAAGSPWLGVFGHRSDVGRAIDRPEAEEPPLRGSSTMPPLAIPYTFFAFSAGFSLGPSLGELHDQGAAAVGRHLPIVTAVGVAYGGLALLGLGRLVARRPRTALLLAAWLLTAFAGAGWMAAANVKVWNARYVAVAFPAYLLVVAAGLASLGSRTRAIALAAVLALSALALWNLGTDPRYAKEDYRSAGAYLAGALGPGDAVIGEGAPAPIFFYAGREPEHYLLVHPHRIGDEAELRRRLAAATGRRPRAWLLRARAYQSDPRNHVGEILGETRRRAARVTFPGVELERYDLAEPSPAPRPAPPPPAAPQAWLPQKTVDRWRLSTASFPGFSSRARVKRAPASALRPCRSRMRARSYRMVSSSGAISRAAWISRSASASRPVLMSQRPLFWRVKELRGARSAARAKPASASRARSRLASAIASFMRAAALRGASQTDRR